MKQGESSAATIVSAAAQEPQLTLVEGPSQKDETELRLQQARNALIELRRQQEELERQKGDLEELRRRQDEYARGKSEMIEKLSRGLVLLERQQIESQRLVEQCVKTQESFREYAEQIHALHDDEWTSENLRAELSRALGVIENSRLEYNRAFTKLECLNPALNQKAEAEPEKRKELGWEDLSRYFLIGAAASAPLILAGTVWAILIIVGQR
jgi:hypothetical protein